MLLILISVIFNHILIPKHKLDLFNESLDNKRNCKKPDGWSDAIFFFSSESWQNQKSRAVVKIDSARKSN